MITLTKAQLKDKQAFVKRYLGKGNNASLSEVDPNSNVSHKTIATMEGEVNKDVHVQMNRHILGEKIKEVFGKKAMKQYYKDLNSHLIYKNDESSLKPYCVALSLIPFLEKGASALAGDSKAPKHLASFCGSYVNLMYALAGQFSGAIAEVSLLFYFHYFAKKDYGDNYLHTHGKEIENYFQQLVYSINSPAGARNHQSIFYNTSIWDRYYYDAMFGGAVYPDGSTPIYDKFHKLQKFFMNWFGEERHKALLTFPVVTCCYLTKDDKPRDEEFVDFLAEQLEKGHSFFHYQSDKASALSSCCRLRNEVEMNQFAYSLGGTGMMTGSLSVMTLNVNHAIQKKVNIKKKVQEIHQYLIAFRMLIQDFKDAGILPAYDEGYIDIEKQYVTVGLNGIVEAAEYLGYEISNNEPYKKWLQELLGTVSSANRESAKYYTEMLGKKVLINTEMIPAENVGVKFRKWDTERGITAKRDCYNSYFYVVEDEEIDIFDRFALHGGDILQYLDGGSCLHLNLDELPNKETWKKIINIAIENGTSYWTSNVKSTCCDDCGYINMHTKDSCIKCGSTNVSYATRVIGYLKKIKSFSKDRQIEAKKRHYHIDNK